MRASFFKIVVCFWIASIVSAHVFASEGSDTQSPNLARDQAIAAVVKQQIAAFQAEDAETAFTFASPGIQSVFKTPQRFIAMVKQSYGMIFDPQVHRLEEVVEAKGDLFQKALFVGKSNVTYRAFYLMEQQEDGSWKINGVSLVRVADQFT